MPVERHLEWDSLAGVWDSVLGRSRSATPFLTREWLSRWWEVLSGGRELILLAARPRPEDAVAAIAPLMLTGEGGVRTIRFVGAGLSDSLDFIVPAEAGDGYVKSFFDFLTSADAPRWDLIWLGDMIAYDGIALRSIEDAVSAAGLRCRRISSVRAPYLRIESDWAGFLAGKSGHFRRILKQKEGRIPRSGEELEVERTRTELGQRTIDDLRAIDRRSWQGLERSATSTGRREMDFLASVFKDFSARGWLDLLIARVGGKPAAYQINFDFGGKAWIYNNAFDRAFASLSLGTILMKRSIEDAFNEGRLECDFLRGEEQYKSEWTDQSREVVQLVIRRNSLRSRLAALWAVRVWRNASLLSTLLRRRLARMKGRG